MWEDACRGDFTLITNALAREYMHSEVAAQCQGVDQSGDMIDDEEDGDMDEEDDQLADQNEMAGSSIASSSFGVPTTGSSSTIVNTATLPTISETGESNEMMTTEDGVEAWEEVGKKKGVSRNKGRK